jgi:hypothetical protein
MRCLPITGGEVVPVHNRGVWSQRLADTFRFSALSLWYAELFLIILRFLAYDGQ